MADDRRTPPGLIDLSRSPGTLWPAAPGEHALRVKLEGVALELKTLLDDALERDDFEAVTRLVEASHAVQLGLVALDRRTRGAPPSTEVAPNTT